MLIGLQKVLAAGAAAPRLLSIALLSINEGSGLRLRTVRRARRAGGRSDHQRCNVFFAFVELTDGTGERHTPHGGSEKISSGKTADTVLDSSPLAP